MSNQRRRQTRTRRFGPDAGRDPYEHNRSVRLWKRYRQLGRAARSAGQALRRLSFSFAALSEAAATLRVRDNTNTKESN